MKEKMPTLQQNQKSCIPTLIANAMQHICFCPNAPTGTTITVRQNDKAFKKLALTINI
jgi:hypothetical protein